MLQFSVKSVVVTYLVNLSICMDGRPIIGTEKGLFMCISRATVRVLVIE